MIKEKTNNLSTCTFDNIVANTLEKKVEMQQNDDIINNNESIDKYLKYEQKYFEDKIDQINFTEGEINSLETHGRAKDKYEIVKMILSRFGIKIVIESRRVQISKDVRKRLRIYKIYYDCDIHDILHCKTKNDHKLYSNGLITYITNFKKFNHLLKNNAPSKKLFKS